MRLITFRNKPRDPSQEESLEEIGAFADSDTKVIRLQAAEKLRSGQVHPQLASMIAFLEGGAEAREMETAVTGRAYALPAPMRETGSFSVVAIQSETEFWRGGRK